MTTKLKGVKERAEVDRRTKAKARTEAQYKLPRTDTQEKDRRKKHMAAKIKRNHKENPPK